MRTRHATTRLLLAPAACAVALLGGSVAAEPRPLAAEPRPLAAEPPIEDSLPSSEIDLGDDPIGVTGEEHALGRLATERDAADAAHAERDRLRYGPRPPVGAPRAGEVLTAQPGTREVAHRAQLWLEHGLLRVEVELQFESSQSRPGELAYRLAVPGDASLASLEVCNTNGCRQGVPDRSTGPFSAYDDAVQARGPGSDSARLPVAHARERDDGRGRALWLRAAPLDKAHPITLRVSYLAPLGSFGGHARLSLPARGMDPQVAPAELTLRGSDLLDTRLDGLPAGPEPLQLDPWSSVELSARVASGGPPRVELWRQPRCGQGGCGRLRIQAGPRPTEPVDLILAIDVSPSTEGPTRGRLAGALVGLLAALPEGSRVRALSFAGRSRLLLPVPSDPAAVPLQRFDSLFDRNGLGSATRFEAAWQDIAALWKAERSPGLARQVLIVGDGGLTRGPAQPFTLARRAGVVVNALNLDEHPARPALREGVASTGGEVLELGAALAREQAGVEPAHLEERLAVLFAARLGAAVRLVVDGRNVELGALHAGEERVWEGPVRRSLRLASPRGQSSRPAPAALRDGLALRDAASRRVGLAAVDPRDFAPGGTPRPEQRADPRGPAQRQSGVSSDLAPVALAEARGAAAAPSSSKTEAAATSDADTTGKGMPQSPLLTMLRRRILPVARGCFRRDRAGRLDYELRAVFEFALAEQEVVAAQVTGKLPAALRDCLLATVDSLEVPRFSGTVLVRYPLHTQAETLAEQIELSPGTAGEVDRLLDPADGG
jgi:hypothetical protein